MRTINFYYKKIHEEKEKSVNDIKKIIFRLTDEIKMNQNTLTTFNYEIKQMKSRKTHIQLQLKELYLKFLKERDEK